jgi:hypothetical protein
MCRNCAWHWATTPGSWDLSRRSIARSYQFIAKVSGATATEPQPKLPGAADGPAPIIVGGEEELAQLQRWNSQVLGRERVVVFVATPHCSIRVMLLLEVNRCSGRNNILRVELSEVATAGFRASSKPLACGRGKRSATAATLC